MSTGFKSMETKRLLFQLVMDDLAYARECQQMHELVMLSKQHPSLQQTFTLFLEDNMIPASTLTPEISN